MNKNDTVCEYCAKRFKRVYEKNRHVKYCKRNDNTDNRVRRYICDKCKGDFSRKDALARHVGKCTGPSLKRKMLEDSIDIISKSIRLNDEAPIQDQPVRCELCDVKVSDYYAHVKDALHASQLCRPLDDNVKIVKSAFNSRIITYRLYPKSSFVVVEEFMISAKSQIVKLIVRAQTEVGKSMKLNLEMSARYMNGPESDVKSFTSDNLVVSLVDDICDFYDAFVCQMTALSDEFQERGSGWAVEEVSHLDINVHKHSPLKGSSWLPLPDCIYRKKACINVKNYDRACFFWAVMSALRPAESHPDSTSSYPHYSRVLRTDKISLPVNLHGIKLFEKLNDISINVYEYESEQIVGPLYYRSLKRKVHINLLFLQDGDRTHYCWIKDLNKLIARQQTKNTRKRWLCDGCFRFYNDQKKLTEHQNGDCAKVKETVPKSKRCLLEFKNYENQLRVPVVVYADFESVLRPVDPGSAETERDRATKAYQLHEAHSGGFYIKCSYDDSWNEYVKSSAESFLDALEEKLKFYSDSMKIKKPMRPLTVSQQIAFATDTKCCVCFNELGQYRVRDHCHLTGYYRGAAHYDCNLRYKLKNDVPVIVHNLAKYDAHFIIRRLTKEDVTLLARNKEHFISFTVTSTKLNLKFRFIDSYAFLSCSLDELASSMDDAQFDIIKKEFTGNEAKMVMQKGVFPYDYVDSLEKLNETSLPPRECFYNKLTEREITEEEYRRAEKVWNEFGLKTLGEYCDLYLKTDVLLLADVFENFRSLCMETYKLDPAHYFTAAGLSWDAMLKHTGVYLQLFNDIDMIKFIKKGIRGGLSQCNVKYSKANNKYMSDYDPGLKSKYIMYLDANNHYGWAMTQLLPVRNFRWLQQREVETLDVLKLDTNCTTGYILEVDLDYPSELHDSHNDLPFCANHKRNESKKVTKLIADLTDKKQYVIHYINLQQAIRNGLILKKIHRVLSFTQFPWAKPYIELNTRKRMDSKSAFEKNFYKLMNNSVFGKTIENVERRVDIRLVNRWESVQNKLGARALISRPNFHSSTILEANLGIIQMKRVSIKYNKPIYVGFSVLELSKTLMSEFHYDYMKRKYKDDVKLMYTDTDSFIYEIYTDDFYDDIRNDLDRFDTSDYPKDNPYWLPSVNKKVLGKFKDEYAGAIIEEFIGVRAKCYYVSRIDGATGAQKEVKKAKGIKKNVVKSTISRDDYHATVVKGDKQYRAMNHIRSRAHKVYSETMTKLALNSVDDKRFVKPNEFYTLAWGHKDIIS